MPGGYGARLMVNVLEEQARDTPDRVFAAIAKSNESQDGFRDVTIRSVRDSVDHVAHLLRGHFKDIQANETIAYLGVPDLRYNLVFYAALKCRMCVFFPSPRNPVEVNVSLLEQTKCTKMVLSSEVAALADKTKLAAKSLDLFVMPSLDELLMARSAPVPYDLDFHQVRNEPVLVLHSSGSTRIPKPVTMTHGTLATIDYRNIPTISGRKNHDLTTWDLEPGSRAYSPFPPFHLAGFWHNLLIPLFTLQTPILGPPLRPPTGRLVAEILRGQDVRSSLMPPSIVVELYSQDDGPQLLRHLEFLSYAGGPLPEKVGNELVKYVTLCQFYGSTEVGAIRQLLPRKEFWQYMEFHPDVKHEMQPAEDGAFELVIYADESTEVKSPLNHNYPGVREWRTKDLFLPHETQAGLWKFHARRDDILVFSSGEKLNPVPIESALTSIDGVAGALIVGAKRPIVGLLLELRLDHTLGPDPVSTLWPSIAAVNEKTPSHGHILKSMICIADAAKPFRRATKGTIIRKLTEAAYQDEIDGLFGAYGATKARTLDVPICELVRAIVKNVLNTSDVDDEANFMLQGLDSIKSIEFLDALKANVAARGLNSDWLSLDTIYSYPSVDKLTGVILAWGKTGVIPSRVHREQRMKDVYESYKAQLLVPPQVASKDKANNTTVILVGSTGFLGQYLLEAVVRDSTIGKVYCLNRSAAASERWQVHASNESVPTPEGKIVFYQANFRSPGFGLGTEILQRLVSEGDVIVHSAWQVNFVLPLPTFQDSLQGLMNSLNIALSARMNFLFVSSIASTGVWTVPGASAHIVPEAGIDDFEAPLRNGYGESKLIGEHLVSAAASFGNLTACILRLGQVAPPSQARSARWPATDLVRTVFDASKSLKAVPHDFLDVHWVSVDVATGTIVDIMRSLLTAEAQTTFQNLVNTTTTSWNQLWPVLSKWCGPNTLTYSFKDWVSTVAQAEGSKDDKLAQAQTLIAFLRLVAEHGALHSFHQEQLLQVSSTARNMTPIDQNTFQRWLEVLD